MPGWDRSPPRWCRAAEGSRACLRLVLAALVIGSGAPARAEQESELPYASRGVVVALSGTVAIPTRLEDEIEVVNDAVVEGPDVDPSLGLHARLGYRLHPRFSAEAHFEWIADIDISTDDATRPGDPPANKESSTLADVHGWTLTADLKGYLLTGRVQPYGLVGLGVMDVSTRNKSGFENGEHRVVLNIEDDDGTSFAARFGAGVDFYLSRRFALVLGASYVLPTGDAEDYDYVSVEWGLQYRF